MHYNNYRTYMLPVYMLHTILYRVHYRPTLAKKTLYLVGLALAGPDVSGLPIICVL